MGASVPAAEAVHVGGSGKQGPANVVILRLSKIWDNGLGNVAAMTGVWQEGALVKCATWAKCLHIAHKFKTSTTSPILNEISHP